MRIGDLVVVEERLQRRLRPAVEKLAYAEKIELNDLPVEDPILDAAIAVVD